MKKSSTDRIQNLISEVLNDIYSNSYRTKVRIIDNNSDSTIQLMYKGEAIQFVYSYVPDKSELLLILSLICDIPDTKGLQFSMLDYIETIGISPFKNVNNIGTLYKAITIIEKYNKLISLYKKYNILDISECISLLYTDNIKYGIKDDIITAISMLEDIDTSTLDVDTSIKRDIKSCIRDFDEILFDSNMNIERGRVFDDNRDFYTILTSGIKLQEVNKSMYNEYKPDFGPSTTLLFKYKSGSIPWREFELLYENEISQLTLEYLQKLIKYKGRVKLLCYCGNKGKCHNDILIKKIKKYKELYNEN